MSAWKRDLRTALIWAVAVAGALDAMIYVINPDHHPTLADVLFAAQFPGWFACAVLLPGSFESIDTVNFIAIGVPVNAVTYALMLFGGLRFRHRAGKRRRCEFQIIYRILEHAS